MKGVDSWKGYHRLTTWITLKVSSFLLSVFFAVVYFLAAFLVSFFLITPYHQVQNWAAYELAGFMESGALPVQRESLAVHYSDGSSHQFLVSNRDSVGQLQDAVSEVKMSSLWAGSMGIGLSAIFTYLTMLGLSRYQTKRSDSEFIRGGQFVEASELKRAIQRDKKDSDLMLGNVPMLAPLEDRHVGVFGDTGTGKSQLLLAIAEWAMERGDKGVILDKSGEFTQHLFNPERDYILSPFDDRSMGWTPYEEGVDLYEFERLAKSFVPMPDGATGGNEHWPEASLTLLSWLFYRQFQEGKTTIDDLVDVMTFAEERVEQNALGEDQVVKVRGLNDLLKGTMADMVIDPSSPEHASSVIGTLVPKIRSLWYLRGLENRPRLSLRKWAEDDSERGWIFIRVTEDQLDAVNPVVTAWLDTLIKSVLSLPKSADRALWAFIDELQSVEKINSLGTGVYEGRKHGLRMVLGAASVNALHERYGEKPVKGMMSMLGTKLIYRTSEPDAAEWNSKMLLEEDVVMEQQGMSFGTNDNLNASDRREKQALVTPSEIATLPDLTAYLRFSGDWPTSQVTLTYKEWPVVATAFAPRQQPDPTSRASTSSSTEAVHGDQSPSDDDPLQEPFI